MTFHDGEIHNYLKMKLDFSNPQFVSISQYGFIQSLTEYYNITETELTPANTKSACESEYIALSDNVTNAIFLRNFLFQILGEPCLDRLG